MSRPRVFTDAQVAAFRAEHAKRLQALRETRSIRQMAADAGVECHTMWLILRGLTYKRAA